MKMDTFTLVAAILVLVGAINWGLIGIGGNSLNLVGLIFGDSFLARLIYLIIGASGVYLIYQKYQNKL